MNIVANAIAFRLYWLLAAALAVASILVYNFGIDAGYVAVLLIGGGVGAVELLGRYLYAPLRAVLTGSGVSYILVNMIAAAGAFYMIGPHGFDVFGQAGATEHQELLKLKAVLLAGFGALAFMRSSIFKFRVGANDIGIGPAAILDTLLLVADRGVDRQEAILRASEVTNLLRGADPVKGAKVLAAYCLALMQNVTAEESKNVLEAVKRIASEAEYDQDIRLDLIALELTKIVGPTVLEAAVIALGSRLSPLRAFDGLSATGSPVMPTPGVQPASGQTVTTAPRSVQAGSGVHVGSGVQGGSGAQGGGRTPPEAILSVEEIKAALDRSPNDQTE